MAWMVGGFKKDYKPKFCWMNGEIIDWMDATTHLRTPVSRGEVVFEGIRAYWSFEKENLFVWLLDEHMKRLLNSAKLRRMRVPYRAKELKLALVASLEANGYREDVYIQPWIFRTYRHPYYTMETTTECAIFARPRGRKFGKKQHVGVKAMVSHWRRLEDPISPVRCKLKANYAGSSLAVLDAKTLGYDAAIMLTSRGKVSEGTGENVFLVRDGQLITPPLTEAILEGITRGFLIEIATQDLGYETVERVVDLSELYIASEVFLCGTGSEICPVVQIDNIQIGDGKRGPITENLQSTFYDIVRAKVPKYEKYLTPVY